MSAVNEHVTRSNQNHQIHWENVKVLQKKRRDFRRKVLEAIHIRNKDPIWKETKDWILIQSGTTWSTPPRPGEENWTSINFDVTVKCDVVQVVYITSQFWEIHQSPQDRLKTRLPGTAKTCPVSETNIWVVLKIKTNLIHFQECFPKLLQYRECVNVESIIVDVPNYVLSSRRTFLNKISWLFFLKWYVFELSSLMGLLVFLHYFAPYNAKS